LKLTVSDPDVEIYAFSFVSSIIPDVITSN